MGTVFFVLRGASEGTERVGKARLTVRSEPVKMGQNDWTVRQISLIGGGKKVEVQDIHRRRWVTAVDAVENGGSSKNLSKKSQCKSSR